MWIFLVKEFIPLIVLGFNVAIFIVIKFNDMKHIEESIKKIEKSVDEMSKEICKNGERLAKVEGKCNANHGN